MIEELGGNADDLIALRQRQPGEPTGTKPAIANDEHRVRRYGTTCLIIGALALALTVISVFLIEDLVDTWQSRLGVVAVVIAFCNTGAAFLGVGLAAIISRYQRALLRNAVDGMRKRGAMVEHVTEVVERINTTMAQVDARLAALEGAVERVPGYGEGVIDGAILRRSVDPDSPPHRAP